MSQRHQTGDPSSQAKSRKGLFRTLGLISAIAFVWLLKRFFQENAEEEEPWTPAPAPGTAPEVAASLSTSAPTSAPEQAPDASPDDDLTTINGIGPVFAKKLREGGVASFTQLAAMTPEQLEEILQAPDWRQPDYPAWIEQARRLSEGD